MNLTDFFQKHPQAAVAFSGGVDSAYLLYEAKKQGAQVHAYYVKSDFQPAFELEDARKLAEQLDVPMTVLELDVLQDQTITQNPWNRCYFCKKRIFSAIAKQAQKDGFTVLLDGTNFSDDGADRPGMKALAELAVLSPLRECRLTKDQIRENSRQAGLFTWDKPAYACLATRIPTGTTITKEKLACTNQAEAFLFSLGFRDFRIRMIGESAKLQVPAGQMEAVFKHRKQIVQELQKHYDHVLLDLEGRDE